MLIPCITKKNIDEYSEEDLMNWIERLGIGDCLISSPAFAEANEYLLFNFFLFIEDFLN